MPGLEGITAKLGNFLRGLQARAGLSGKQGCDVPILCYHEIGSQEHSEHGSIYQRASDFESQISWLARAGYKFISLDQAVELIRSGAGQNEKAAVITFDDGYEGVYKNAFPVLRKFGYPATVFVIASKIESAEFTSFPYLSRSQILEMVRGGIGFGSHSMTHTDLTTLPEGELKREVYDSKKKIEDLTSRVVRHFCHPYGRFDERVMRVVQESSYESACATTPGRWNSAEDLFRMRRVTIGSGGNIAKLFYNIEVLSWRRN